MYLCASNNSYHKRLLLPYIASNNWFIPREARVLCGVQTEFLNTMQLNISLQRVNLIMLTLNESVANYQRDETSPHRIYYLPKIHINIILR